MIRVPLSEVVEAHKLKVLTQGIDLSEIFLTEPEINRPALQLTGFFEYFDVERLQIIGWVEQSYLEKMHPALRLSALERLFSYNIPALVLCRGLEPMPETLSVAAARGIPVLQTEMPTSDFMAEIIKWLKVQLAPRITKHGVLMDIYGEGVLITGESGIGKSETALELIKRGHRFVADDAVEILRVSHDTLVGRCPELIRYFIELRGIGIVNVEQMFGAQSVRQTMTINLIINLELWDKTKEYDRLGLHETYVEILGNQMVAHDVPVKPGRNLALICEAAAVNLRQKKMGYNAAKELLMRLGIKSH
jgi:HPr kinase/phosphorylase